MRNILAILCISFTSAAVINIPIDYSTIQDGINASATGDTVLVQSGYYYENVIISAKNISVLGFDKETTIINGSNNGRPITINNVDCPECVFGNFTLLNGNAYGSGAEDDGGGVYCRFSNLTLFELLILDNRAWDNGGGLYIAGGNVNASSIVISGNQSNCGGGIHTTENAYFNLTDSQIINNSSDPTCQGGGVNNGGGLSIYQNVLIANNSGHDGGGVICRDSECQLDNVTIAQNQSGNNTGGLYSQGADVSLKNVIIFDNEGAEISLHSGSVAVTYSDIQSGWSGEGNITSVPLFVDVDNGDYHLTMFSPCIDVGDPNSQLDPDGTVSDMGAYYFHQESGCTDPLALNHNPDATEDDGSCEYYDGPTWYVSVDGTDQIGYGSEENPFGSIQYGIESSSNTDTVVVNPGTYFDNINFNGHNITLGSRYLTTADTSYISQTIIDGGQNGSVVTFNSGEDSTTVLTGFTITNGTGIICTDCGGMSGNRVGGGVFIFDSNPQLNNLLIAQNEHLDLFWGGGVFLWESDVIIDNCVITNNETHSSGGGIAISNSNPTIINSIISDNYTDHNGGGVSIAYNSLPYFENCLIENNIITINGRGAGIYFEDSSGTVNNCQILGNQNQGEISSGGGGLALWISDIIVDDSIISGNSATFEGGGFYLKQNSTITISNSVISENIAQKGGGIYSFESDGLNITSSDILANSATSSHGGGIYVAYSPGGVTIDSTQISSNIANEDGGGLYLFEPDIFHTYNPSSVNNTIIESNISGDGGGIYFENCNDVTVNNSSINSNQAGNGIGSLPERLGGGIYVNNSKLNLYNSTIQTNISSEAGGGIAYLGSDSLQTLTNCKVLDNQSDYGGGIYGHGSPNDIYFKIENTEVTGNFSTNHGGGMKFLWSRGNINNSIISHNTSDFGGGISFMHNTHSNNLWYLNNCTLYGNTANIGGGLGIDTSPMIYLINTILWENTIDQIYTFYGSANTIYSDIQGGWTGIGNIDSDPIFVDSNDGNFNLQAGSPCIDSGNPESEYDPDDTVADMGAYYFHQSFGCTDSLALNFEPNATVDDGSCYFGEPGCNDDLAYNYDEDAYGNDGSCIYYGDVTQDGSIDVADVIAMVSYVLDLMTPTPDQILIGDLIEDGDLNVFDVVAIIDIILANTLLDSLPLKDATLIQNKNSLTLSKSGSVAGLQIEYEGEFESSLEGWLIEKNENTILMVSLDGSDFNEIPYTGDLKIKSCSVIDWEMNKIQAEITVIPDQFSLKPAYPNPFNPATTINYAIPYDAYVVIKAFDVRGKEVAELVNGMIEEGIHEVVWDASKLSSGMYFVRMTSGDFKAVRKIIFIK
jgi:parallel beta-helix repeat protein